mgnify:FL=1
MTVCSECRTNNITKDYRETTVTKHNTKTKYYCKDCLTSYAENTNHGRTTKTRLRDTNIDKYNEAINDYRFIPLAFRMKINQNTGEVMVLQTTQ